MSQIPRLKRKKQFADESDTWVVKSAKKKTHVKQSSLLNQTVMRLINKNREVKTAQYSVAFNLNAYTGTSWATPGVHALTPYSGFVSIIQGTGQGDRIGNKIEIVSAKLKMTFNPLPYNATSNAIPQPQLVLGWVAKVKNSTAQPTALGTFFQAGDASSGPNGTTIDTTRPINTDNYKLYKSFVKKVGYAAYLGTGTAPQSGNFSNNDFNLSQTVSLDLTKSIPKIIDYNDTTNLPTSDAVWLFLEAINADGTAQAAAVLSTYCQFTYSILFRDS